MVPPIVVRALALVVAGAAAGLAVNAARPGGVRLGSFAAATACVVSAGAGEGGDGFVPTAATETLPPAAAMALCGTAGVLVADVRPAARFASGHVAGAVHLPCAASGAAVDRAITELQGKHAVIVYGDTTAEAAPVAESLRQRLPAPATRVIVIDGGFPAWDRAGLACSSGPCLGCQVSTHPEHPR